MGGLATLKACKATESYPVDSEASQWKMHQNFCCLGRSQSVFQVNYFLNSWWQMEIGKRSHNGKKPHPEAGDRLDQIVLMLYWSSGLLLDLSNYSERRVADSSCAFA